MHVLLANLLLLAATSLSASTESRSSARDTAARRANMEARECVACLMISALLANTMIVCSSLARVCVCGFIDLASQTAAAAADRPRPTARPSSSRQFTGASPQG